MFSTLPEPDRRPLRDAPLNLVVFSLEFAAGAEWKPNSGLRWRAALKERGIEGKLVGVKQAQVAIQMAGNQPQGTTTSRDGYALHGDEGQTAGIYESAMIVEYRNYTTWSEYRAHLERLLDAARDVRDPQVVQSMSLRYINALSHDDAESAAFWVGKVSRDFLGPFENKALRPSLQKALYFLSFQNMADDFGAELRVGIQPDAVRPGRVAFVFDMEFTRQEQEEFSLSEILQTADRMNTAALQLFQQIVDEKYREQLVGIDR